VSVDILGIGDDAPARSTTYSSPDSSSPNELICIEVSNRSPFGVDRPPDHGIIQIVPEQKSPKT